DSPLRLVRARNLHDQPESENPDRHLGKIPVLEIEPVQLRGQIPQQLPRGIVTELINVRSEDWIRLRLEQSIDREEVLCCDNGHGDGTRQPHGHAEDCPRSGSFSLQLLSPDKSLRRKVESIGQGLFDLWPVSF